MLVTSIREEHQRIYQKGQTQGIAQGITQGKIERQWEIAKKLLYKGMEISFIAEVTDLSEEEVLKLKVKH